MDSGYKNNDSMLDCHDVGVLHAQSTGSLLNTRCQPTTQYPSHTYNVGGQGSYTGVCQDLYMDFHSCWWFKVWRFMRLGKRLTDRIVIPFPSRALAPHRHTSPSRNPLSLSSSNSHFSLARLTSLYRDVPPFQKSSQAPRRYVGWCLLQSG
ncbi:hypothetical protein OG21DRAFT_1219690 [Imleria badia]|nr:hypothetical protein OG21DRAFT_1219690 [Imleria badia]